MNKKGQIEELGKLIAPLVAIGVIFAVGFLIMNEIRDSDTMVAGACANTSATYDDATATCSGGGPNNGTTALMNASLETASSMAGIPGWLSIVIITVIGVLLIGIVSMFRRR